jgi:hypothetical protein
MADREVGRSGDPTTIYILDSSTITAIPASYRGEERAREMCCVCWSLNRSVGRRRISLARLMKGKARSADQHHIFTSHHPSIPSRSLGQNTLNIHSATPSPAPPVSRCRHRRRTCRECRIRPSTQSGRPDLWSTSTPTSSSRIPLSCRTMVIQDNMVDRHRDMDRDWVVRRRRKEHSGYQRPACP